MKELEQIAPEPTTDFTPQDVEKINAYIEDGLPAISSIDDSKMYRIFELYLSGRTYHDISRSLGIKKIQIMYLSHKFGWYMARREYMNELETSVRARVLDAKTVSQDFLLQMTHFFQARISKKVNKYFATGDESVADSLDFKEYDKYLKTVEMLQKISADPRSGSGEQKPTVGLNLGDGVTVRKVGNNEVEITPRQKSISDMLRQFAESNKKKPEPGSDTEKSDPESSYDIDNTQGE